MNIFMDAINWGTIIVLNLMIIYLFFSGYKLFTRRLKSIFYFLISIALMSWILSAVYGFQIKSEMNVVFLSKDSVTSEEIDLFKNMLQNKYRILLNAIDILHNLLILTLVALVHKLLKSQGH